MNNVQIAGSVIPAMSLQAIDKVRELTEIFKEAPQYALETNHIIHGGMYSRTITMPAGHVLTGSLVKVNTLLIINGHVTAYLGDIGSAEFNGYGVVPASAGRKQAFISHADTDITMIFATDATSVEEAEAELTDEADMLVSRSDTGSNNVLITGE